MNYKYRFIHDVNLIFASMDRPGTRSQSVSVLSRIITVLFRIQTPEVNTCFIYLKTFYLKSKNIISLFVYIFGIYLLNLLAAKVLNFITILFNTFMFLWQKTKVVFILHINDKGKKRSLMHSIYFFSYFPLYVYFL